MIQRKMTAFAYGAALVATSLMIGCNRGQRNVDDLIAQEELTQRALDAEKAEQKIAEVAKGSSAEKAARGPKSAKETSKALAKAQKQAEGVSRKPASRGSIFVVQVGAFKVKENAERMHTKLKELGYPVQVQSLEHSKNGLLHLVRFEPSKSRDEAQGLVEKLKEKEFSAQVLALQ